MPGSVYVIDDDLSVGPLYNDETREDWWAVVWKATFGEACRPGVYKQWEALAELMRAQGTEELVLWSSGSARDYVLDRMAASMLARYGGLISHVEVPPNGTLYGVGLVPPEHLASYESTRVPLEHDALARFAADFDAELRNSVGVRCLRDGAILSLPNSVFDQALLDTSQSEWMKWYRVVGSVMADCDGRNLVGDVFLDWRLHCLAEAGKIELRGSPQFPRDRSNVLVRRSDAT